MSVDKYDLGNADSPYFEDKNKGVKTEIVSHHCDCEGNDFCTISTELAPYFQAHEILAPVFISTTWGSETYYKGKLGQDGYRKKGITYLHISKPFKVGDIILLKGDCCAKYYLKAKLRKRDKYNNFIYQVERIDGFMIAQIDLDKFKKNKEVTVRGYFSENQ